MPGYVVFALDKDTKPAPVVNAGTETKEVPSTEQPVKPAPTFPEWPLLLGGIFFIFYFVVLRPQKRRQEKERLEQQNLLNKNDKIITTAGIYGTIVSISDKEDEVTVKVDDNTRLKMLKASIMRNITREETLKAEKEAKTQEKSK